MKHFTAFWLGVDVGAVMIFGAVLWKSHSLNAYLYAIPAWIIAMVLSFVVERCSKDRTPDAR